VIGGNRETGRGKGQGVHLSTVLRGTEGPELIQSVINNLPSL